MKLHRNAPITLLFTALALHATGASGADVVNRKSTATRATGTITEVSKTGVTIKPLTGDPVTIPANDVGSIEWDAGSAGLKLAWSDETGGRYEKALDGYRKSLADVKAGEDNLKTGVEYAIARTTAKIALADPARRDEAIKLLQGFLSSHGDSYHYYDAQKHLGLVYMAQQDYDNAQQAFDVLGNAPWNDAKMAAKSATARIQMAQDKVDEALRTFDEVIAMPAQTPSELARHYEAQLGKARGLIRQNQYDEAVKRLDEVITKASAENSSLQAEAYVLQGDCLQALNRTKEAVLAYLHVDVLYPRESSLHAESLFHLSRLWKVVQSPERAAEAQAKLETVYPNSEWTKKLSGAQ